MHTRGFERIIGVFVALFVVCPVILAGNKAQINLQPTSQSAGVGANTSFFVTATGDPTILYQWSFDGAPIPGATSQLLSLPNIQTTNQGSYQVVVTNDFGSSTSSVVTLQVVLTPGISSFSGSASVVVGSSATFSVSATGQPPFTYQWDFDSVAITGATNSTYTVSSAQTTNAGSYQVFITNSSGNIASPIQALAVTLAPVVNGSNSSGPTTLGGSATFTVFAQGALPLQYQWDFETATTTNAIPNATNSAITITNVQSTNAGSYQLFITNAYGNAAGPAIPLVIVAGLPPGIGSQPQNQTVPQGFLGSFQVLVSGTAPLVYQWSFDGAPIANATNAALFLNNVQSSNAGSYQVIVTNGFGAKTSVVATLNVQLVPTQASGVTVTPLLSLSAATHGSDPTSAVTFGLDGDLYVTTSAGGTNDVGSGGDGTISKLDTNGNVFWTFSLTQAGGANPAAGLTSGGGNIYYGTAANGGAGFGTVFRIDSSGNFTPLYTFANGTDGAHPIAGLILGQDGFLYGSTSQGGANDVTSGGDGTIFKISTNGTLVWSFSFNKLNGDDPVSALAQGLNGVLYGTTFSGGVNNVGSGGSGTIFSITTNGFFASLYSFTAGSDGSYPYAGVTVGPDGGLYGTTTSGGNLALNAGFGFGTIFEFIPSGAIFVLTNFNGTNGISPMATLTLGRDENFYGTTLRGGISYPNTGYGTVYRVGMNGNLTTLISFDGSLDGANPAAGVVEVASGIFYGTTSRGGTNNLASGGDGVIFRLGAPPGGPGLANIGNQLAAVNQTLMIPIQAYGGTPPVTLSLAPGAPAGATLSSAGVFSWTPTCEEGGTSNQITIWAVDSGVPALSNSMTFTVMVGQCVQVSIGSGPVQVGQSTCLPVTLVTSMALTNVNFSIAVMDNRLTNWSASPANPSLVSASVQTTLPLQPQFTFTTLTGQTLNGSNLLGYVCVNVLNTRTSAFVPLTLGNILAATTGGISAGPDFAQSGELVLVQAQPLLEATGSPRGVPPQLLLYGNPGTNYFLQYTISLNSPINWAPLTNFILTGLVTNFNPASASDVMEFYRAYYIP